MPGYVKAPTVAAGDARGCARGWDAVAARLLSAGARVIVVEAFPGVRRDDLLELAGRLRPDFVVETSTLFRPPSEVNALVLPELTHDPVFGRISGLTMRDFIDPQRLAGLASSVADARGSVLIMGPGASLVARGDVLVLAEMPRWETQLRQRRGEVDNLGADNRDQPASMLYKRSYFVDWRVCDRLKNEAWHDVDLFLDTTRAEPRMIAREAIERALSAAASGPFRVVPYFDPAPWGGQWMRRVCDLDPGPPNFGWCFDCVPEENSLLLDFGGTTFETPAQNLVFQRPRELLGDAVTARFGCEFPIRFDFLDTVGGGNLSLQVNVIGLYVYGLNKSGIGPGRRIINGINWGIGDVDINQGLVRQTRSRVRDLVSKCSYSVK